MAMTIIYGGAGLSHGEMIVLDRKLWLTADRNHVVEDGSPKARFLLGTEGTQLSLEEARRLDLVADDDDETTAPAEPKAQPVTKNKQRNISRNKSQEGEDDGEE